MAHQRPARPAVVKDTDQHERVHTPEVGDVAGRSLEPPARIRRRTTVKPNVRTLSRSSAPALEVVDLALLPRRMLHDVHDLGPTAPDPPHEPLHRELPIDEGALRAEVLRDPLGGQAPLHPGPDHSPEGLAGAHRPRPRAGNRVWPVFLPEKPSSASAIPGPAIGLAGFADRLGSYPEIVSRRIPVSFSIRR